MTSQPRNAPGYPAAIVDISRSLADPEAVWPGDPPLETRPFETMAGHGRLSSALSMSAHCGTHLDLPAHVVPGGATVEAFAASRFVLPALVLDVDIGAPGRGGVVDEAMARAALEGPNAPRPGVAMLWRTGRRGFVTARAARLLADFGAGLVGVESASVDDSGDEALPAHHALLGEGVPVLEGLDLSGAAPGPWLLVCPPLPAPGLEASPVRALLMRFE